MNKSAQIRILIADDHAIVRMGLCALFEPEADITVVGEADDGNSAIAACRKLNPDVVIMDIMMPGIDGIEATRTIQRELPGIKILVLTTSGASDDIAAALSAGARGALLKSTANPQLIQAIRQLAAGKTVISDDVRHLLADDPPSPELTDRQIQILSAITRGLTNSDISRMLKLQEDSVKEHIITIYKKLGAANRAEAAAIAVRKHLLKTESRMGEGVPRHQG